MPPDTKDGSKELMDRYGSDGFRRTAWLLDRAEAQWYQKNLHVEGFQGYPGAPASGVAQLDYLEDASWETVMNNLVARLEKYQRWRREKLKQYPSGCLEAVHLIGFSDGASTIAGFLNGEGSDPKQFRPGSGLVGLVDCVRKYKHVGWNTDAAKTYTVNTQSFGATHFAVRNPDGWRTLLPLGAAGYNLTGGWNLKPVHVPHVDVAKHQTTRDHLETGLKKALDKLFRDSPLRR